MDKPTDSRIQDVLKTEADTLACWQRTGSRSFQPDAAAEPYLMLMPVPNITGSLHIGHAVNLVLMDALVRHHRQAGRNVYFPPGTDHAGIYAQYAAERELEARGTTREELGRERFQEHMLDWTRRHQRLLLGQMQRLGLDADWSAQWFTMDEPRNRVVWQTFVDLHRRDLVYRDQAVVNWCSRCGTALSDMELRLEEVKKIAYKIRLSTRFGLEQLVTVRPELLLGAVALGVSHAHPHAMELIGTQVELPVLGRSVPVISIPERSTAGQSRAFVGALALVLPAYNAGDLDLARELGLPIREIYSRDGRMASDLGEYSGMDVEACRTLLLKQLKSADALTSTEDYPQGTMLHGLCGTEISPIVSQQWYLRVHRMVEPARELAESGTLDFNHEFWKKGYLKTLEGIESRERAKPQRWWEGACVAVAEGYSSNKDWVISRQNWWGQSVPAWHCTACQRTTVDFPIPNRCVHCGSESGAADTDVLDVWFSCAMWPVSVSPWQRQAAFADGSVLGHDIFYFWLTSSNMIALALFGRPAFGEILVHGLLCDEHGKKMSKSVGNVVALEEEVTRGGAEAVRSFALTAFAGKNGEEWLTLHSKSFEEARERVAALHDKLRTMPIGDSDGDLPGLADTEKLVKQRMAQRLVGDAYTATLAFLEDKAYSATRLSPATYARILKLVQPFHPFLASHFDRLRLDGAARLSDSAPPLVFQDA